LLKFGHSMTAIAFLGAVAVLWVLHQQLPDPEGALSLYASGRQAMERIAVLLLLPSLVCLCFWMSRWRWCRVPQCALGVG